MNAGCRRPGAGDRAALHLAFIVALAAGCGAAARQGPAAFAEVGRYPFVAEVPGGLRIAGTIDVTPDTLVAWPNGVVCGVAAQQQSASHLAYDCVVPGTPGVTLLLDRRSPVRRSTWTMLTQVVRTRDICKEWRTWENGTRSCTRSDREEYIERVRVQGPLVVGR